MDTFGKIVSKLKQFEGKDTKGMSIKILAPDSDKENPGGFNEDYEKSIEKTNKIKERVKVAFE